MTSIRIPTFLSVLALAGAVLAQGSGLPASSQESLKAQADLKAEFPDVRFEMLDGRVSRIYGTPFSTGFTPEQSAAAFLNEYAQALDPGNSTFVYRRSRQLMDGKFTAVYYDQKALGMTVDAGAVTLLVRNEVGSPLVLAVSKVKPVSLARRLGQIPGTRAVDIVRATDKSLSLKTTPVLAAWQDGAVTRVAWTFAVGNDSKTDPKYFAAFVDASSGAILEKRNGVYNLDVNGTVTGWASPGLFPNIPTAYPAVETAMKDVRVRIIGGSTSFSDAAGAFTIPHGGIAPVTVEATLRGPSARVFNDAGAETVLTKGLVPPGPGSFTFNTGLSEFEQAEVDGFIHTTYIHDFVKAINPTFTEVDIQIPVTVNIASACNAFYSASSINFFASGGGCVNTAYSTVVYHEYGHFIIDMGNNNNPSGDYHEGMSDVTAAFAANDPCLAIDFQGETTGCLRNSYNAVVHPCVGPSHTCGQVISGAFWLTKDEVDVTEGPGPSLDIMRDLYLNSILLEPGDIDLGITVDVLTLDDNDPFVWNGTPHYTEIATGFGAKNLFAPPIDNGYLSSGISTIMGSHAGGGLPQIQTQDNTYYSALSVDMPGLGYFAAVQAEFTIAEPAASVDTLSVVLESSIPAGNLDTGTIYFWNWNTSQFEYVSAHQVIPGTDTIRAGRLTTNVAKYVNGAGQVRVAYRVHDPLRRAGARPSQFTLNLDYIELFVGS